jgi:RNA polymerase sigma-70 factor, ECF subfamily
MAMGTPGTEDERFARLYGEHGRDVLAYALRRAAGPEDAADVVAETFLAAWRRLADVPAGTDARLWLYGVARRVLANQRRGERRRLRLGERLRDDLSALAVPGPPASAADHAVLVALSRLDEGDRELLLLVGWEELEPAEAARVVGASAVAVRSRLHRARRRLRAAMRAAESGGAGSAHGLEIERAR